MLNQKAMVIGAIGGFVSALLVDLHAWGGGEAFNWRKAMARWVGGAISGALAAIGIGTMV